MAGGIICSNVVVHTPRMAIEENAPDFVRGFIGAEREMGAFLRAMKPDLFVIQSTHWVSSFLWFATCQAVHEGYCVADEAPDMIPGQPYKYKGDPDFAYALIDKMKGADIACGANETKHYHWDYGTYVPLHYLDPDAEIPVVSLPVCIMADLNENIAVGRLIHEVAVATGKRVIFLGSNALSHRLVRGPDTWPLPEHREMDKKFVDLALAGKVEELLDWLPTFSRDAVAEMGGRVLGCYLGAYDAMKQSAGGAAITGRQFGPYGQSSGSGNVNFAVWPAA